MASLPYPRSLSLSSLLHLFIFRAERLGREKVLKVVGLNPTGITMGVQLSQLHLFILGGYGILPYPRSLSFSSLLNLFILEQKDLVEKKF